MVHKLGNILFSKWRGALRSYTKWKAFIDRQDKKVKSELFQERSFSLSRSQGVRQVSSLVLTRKFQTSLYKIPLLGDAENALRLDIKLWWWGLA